MTLKTMFKNLFAKSTCPKCNWFTTCLKCGNRLGYVDDELTNKGL